MSYTWGLRPKGVPCSGFRWSRIIGAISQAEVYERAGKVMKVCERGNFFQFKVDERSTFSVKMLYKGKELDLGAEPPSIKLCRVSPYPPRCPRETQAP